MNGGGIVWLVIAAASAVLFFGIAVVVSLLGAGDLRDLLRGAHARSDGQEDTS